MKNTQHAAASLLLALVAAAALAADPRPIGAPRPGGPSMPPGVPGGFPGMPPGVPPGSPTPPAAVAPAAPKTPALKPGEKVVQAWLLHRPDAGDVKFTGKVSPEPEVKTNDFGLDGNTAVVLNGKTATAQDLRSGTALSIIYDMASNVAQHIDAFSGGTPVDFDGLAAALTLSGPAAATGVPTVPENEAPQFHITFRNTSDSAYSINTTPLVRSSGHPFELTVFGTSGLVYHAIPHVPPQPVPVPTPAPAAGPRPPAPVIPVPGLTPMNPGQSVDVLIPLTTDVRWRITEGTTTKGEAKELPQGTYWAFVTFKTGPMTGQVRAKTDPPQWHQGAPITTDVIKFTVGEKVLTDADKKGHYTGKVLDNAGKPVSAQITVTAKDSTTPLANVSTQSDGSFDFLVDPGTSLTLTVTVGGKVLTQRAEQTSKAGTTLKFGTISVRLPPPPKATP